MKQSSDMSPRDPVEIMLDQVISAGELAGAATLIWRGGRVVQSAAVGWRDLAAGLPVERDTLFCIASLSKPRWVIFANPPYGPLHF